MVYGLRQAESYVVVLAYWSCSNADAWMRRGVVAVLEESPLAVLATCVFVSGFVHSCRVQ